MPKYSDTYRHGLDMQNSWKEPTDFPGKWHLHVLKIHWISAPSSAAEVPLEVNSQSLKLPLPNPDSESEAEDRV